MRPAPAIEIALRVLQPIVAMHASGAIHGDLRAERIFVDRVRVRILSPERAASATHATKEDDAASVASILYELLTRAPADHEGPASQHNPIALPARLVEVVDRARRDRALDADAFAHELRVCLLDALGAAKRLRF